MKKAVIILALLALFQCVKKDKQQDLSKSLSNAYFDHRLSKKHIDEIINEHARINVKDSIQGKAYIMAVTDVLDKGGDSTEVNEVRKQFQK